ncbi:hypothetical protein O6H91_05G111200 [Diphasiastrum complanatum]|uniref:Uncharacterized protein n=1 Tax=Diphasiastrum complanatum TaxID=34168 RepID=A0ACC2DRY8_DIPCM|nr:hypothetical protein O6H91_05G111200 [Diphasiastrum complanatum]
MGREREKKASVQQLWQAKPRAVEAGTVASAAQKVPSKEELGGVYEEDEEEEEGLGVEQVGAMRGGAAEGSAGAMRDQQARTKVVVRHLPPSLSEQVFLEQIESKYADTYIWVAFYPGKSSHRRQIHSRAYINFQNSENVVDFYEDFDGHVFVSERGAQCKAMVEYAPHQRPPSLSLKKDIREGTIFKDPEYVEFLGMSAKPIEYLPSAEVQLERREAEKAAILASGGVRESVIITPLMEYVRHKRAAKAAPQRSNSFSGKSALQGGITGASPKGFSSKKRGAVRLKSNTQMHSMDSAVPTIASQKEVHLASLKEEYHGNREAVGKRKNDRDEVKDKKVVHEAASSVPTFRGNSTYASTDGTKEFASRYSPKELTENAAIVSNAVIVPEGTFYGADVRKDVIVNKREILRRKQPVEKVKEDSIELANANSSYLNKESGAISQKHRPPVSPKVTSAVQQQQGASPPGGRVSMNITSKVNRRESAAKSSRGGVSLSKEQMLPTQQVLFNLESKVPTDGVTSNPSSIHSVSPVPGSDRQDTRRVKNKDRPDRPVWTPRRRADNPQRADFSMPMAPSMKSSESLPPLLTGSSNSSTEKGDKSSYNQKSVPGMGERESEQQLIGLSFDHESFDGNHGSIVDSISESLTLGSTKPGSRGDRIISGVKEHNGVTMPPDGGKSAKRAGGAVVFTANEKQMWVAKSTLGP